MRLSLSPTLTASPRAGNVLGIRNELDSRFGKASTHENGSERCGHSGAYGRLVWNERMAEDNTCSANMHFAGVLNPFAVT